MGRTLVQFACVATTLALLNGCGGSDGGSASNATTPVTPQNSPIADATGVQLAASGGGVIYGLTSDAASTSTKTIEVRKLNAASNLSGLVGEGFTRFGGFARGDFAAVSSVGIVAVAECDLATKRCAAIPFENRQGLVVFDIVDGKYYAIQK
ncbi:MAG: hypothetical protein V4684_01580 [Pseudomonadota bacterium]